MSLTLFGFFRELPNRLPLNIFLFYQKNPPKSKIRYSIDKKFFSMQPYFSQLARCFTRKSFLSDIFPIFQRGCFMLLQYTFLIRSLASYIGNNKTNEKCLPSSQLASTLMNNFRVQLVSCAVAMQTKLTAIVKTVKTYTYSRITRNKKRS